MLVLAQWGIHSSPGGPIPKQQNQEKPSCGLGHAIKLAVPKPGQLPKFNHVINF